MTTAYVTFSEIINHQKHYTWHLPHLCNWFEVWNRTL